MYTIYGGLRLETVHILTWWVSTNILAAERPIGRISQAKMNISEDRKKHNLLDMVDIKLVHAKNKEKQSHWDRSCSPG